MKNKSILIASITFITLLSITNNALAGSAEVDQEIRRTNELLRQAPDYQRRSEQSGRASQADLDRLRASCNNGNKNACSQYGYRVRAKERYRRYLQQKQMNFYRNRRIQ